MGIDVAGTYEIVLNSDDEIFGGHKRIDKNVKYHTSMEGFAGRSNSMLAYLPNRTALLFAKTA